MAFLCHLVAVALVMRTHVAIENIAVRYAGRPGLAPAGEALVLCFAKEKYPKERRPAVWVPSLRFGHLAVLEPVGVTCKLAALKQARALICPLLRSSAQPGRAWGKGKRQNSQILFPHLLVIADLIRNPWGTERGWIPDQVRDDREKREPESESIPHPVEAGPSSADGGGRSGQTCLSRRRVVWKAAGARPGRYVKGKAVDSAQPVRGKK